MPPSGTVTFLFTDIEGSTRLWETLPEPMKLAFARQEAILREGITSHGGYPYKMIGDAFQAAFSSALDALNAAVEIQRSVSAEAWGETPIRVRMALHSGVTEERGDDYVGPILNRLARLLSIGYGGQILLTAATTDLLIDQLPEEIQLIDKGVHHLKDLLRPEHIYQVDAPGLRSSFPALKTIEGLPNNLPLLLTSFVGRENEMSDLRELLSHPETRLVTLTGPGGTGKTRLSIQIGMDLLGTFPGGVWLVELAPITDPERITHLIASILNIRASEDRPLITSLIDGLRSRRTLLILDNCEHLIEACAALADQLLRACPNLLILTSSREILGIGGENPFRVPSLSMPDPRHSTELDTLAQSEAVTLFVQRARAVSQNFHLNEENAADVVQIVRRLDGIPLAIELAAARVRMLNPAQIAVRLNDAFHLLTGGSRTVLPRHQTLQALIDWSYNLLSNKEIILLRRLSVFSSSWTLEDAEAVCPDPAEKSDPSGLQAGEILDVLTSLADKSMILSIPEPGEGSRFRMMETIHQYALEKLAASGESAGLRERHIGYYLSLAEKAEPFLRGSQQVVWMNRLESMEENLHGAMEWGLEKNIAAELRLAAALMWFWHIRGQAAEGIQWLRLGLTKLSTAPETISSLPGVKIRAKALLNLGALISIHEEPRQAVPFLEESLSLYQAMESEGLAGKAYCYNWLATCANRRHDLKTAEVLATTALQLFRDLNDRFGQSECLLMLAGWPNIPVETEKAYLQVLDLKRQIGDVDGIASCLLFLAHTNIAKGDYQRASILLNESLERFREVGNHRFTVTGLHSKATIHWIQGNYSLALQYIEEAIGISSDSGDNRQHMLNLLRKGDILLSTGDQDAARSVFTEALRVAQESADRRSTGNALAALGNVDLLCQRIEQAEQHLNAALSLAQALHFRPLVYTVQLQQGKLAALRGDWAMADSLMRECLRGELDMKFGREIAYPLLGLAFLAWRQHEPERSASLTGTATRHFRLVENTLPRSERDQYALYLAELHTVLGEDLFLRCWQEEYNLADGIHTDR